MSGGHFDYAQYRIDDIIESIEREIEQATCERPPLVTEQGVVVKQKLGEGHYRYPSWGIGFRSFESSEKYFKEHGYQELDRIEENGERKLVVQDFVTKEIYEICTYTSQHYAPDENGEIPYVPDWSEETLQEFRRGISILKRARIYAQRIDWLLSGDDGEESFHKRLKEKLDKLNKEEKENGDRNH